MLGQVAGEGEQARPLPELEDPGRTGSCSVRLVTVTTVSNSIASSISGWTAYR